MAVDGIDHYTIITEDLAATRRFYCDLLGLSEGPRPAFEFPGAWLYAGGHPIVHIVCGRPIPSGPTGAVDHLAFRASGDIRAMAAKLSAAGIANDSRMVPGAPVWQLFCRDPSGVRIELNYQPAA